MCAKGTRAYIRATMTLIEEEDRIKNEIEVLNAASAFEITTLATLRTKEDGYDTETSISSTFAVDKDDISSIQRIADLRDMLVDERKARLRRINDILQARGINDLKSYV